MKKLLYIYIMTKIKYFKKLETKIEKKNYRLKMKNY